MGNWPVQVKNDTDATSVTRTIGQNKIASYPIQADPAGAAYRSALLEVAQTLTQFVAENNIAEKSEKEETQNG